MTSDNDWTVLDSIRISIKIAFPAAAMNGTKDTLIVVELICQIAPPAPVNLIQSELMEISSLKGFGSAWCWWAARWSDHVARRSDQLYKAGQSE